ncbi:MAG: hypothetical protein WCC92_01115 [Candidatus Korobacteraceae bacterium]
MPQVLTTNAVILCPHGGKGTTTPLHPKWQINGGYVSVENDPGVLACPFLLLPCVGYQLRSMGLNATQIDSQKVILVTDFNQTLTGLPLTMVETHQTFDESTVAGIPAGQSAPPPSPELADLAPPVITPPMQAIPFSISTTTVPVVATFSMTTTYPMLWILTLLNTQLKVHLDLTNGLPGATVSPSGGDWSSPSLTIVVTMTPPFLAALQPGTHYLYLTGVSKRGLSGYAEAIVTVSP